MHATLLWQKPQNMFLSVGLADSMIDVGISGFDMAEKPEVPWVWRGLISDGAASKSEQRKQINMHGIL